MPDTRGGQPIWSGQQGRGRIEGDQARAGGPSRGSCGRAGTGGIDISAGGGQEGRAQTPGKSGYRLETEVIQR